MISRNSPHGRRIFGRKAKSRRLPSLKSILEVTGFFLTAVGVWASVVALNVANDTRRDQLIAVARADLLSPPITVVDLGARLQNYLDLGQTLDGVMLTCTQVQESCRPFSLTNFHVGGGNQRADALSGSAIRNARIANASLTGVKIDHSAWGPVSFIDVRFTDCDFDVFRLTATFESTSFERCKLRFMTFEGSDLSGADFGDSRMSFIDVSGTRLCQDIDRCMTMTPAQARETFYFEDRPPIGIEHLSGELRPTMCPKGAGGEEPASAPLCRFIADDAR